MINLGLLRKEGVVPRVHGNGFIQLDLDEATRLHIWGDPEIPKQKVLTPIHDHVFGFESMIVVGRMINIRYDWCPRTWGNMQIYTAHCREGSDTMLKATGHFGYAKPSGTEVIEWSSPKYSYRMFPHVFHESIATEPTATIIKKDGPTASQGNPVLPRVLALHNRKPDNDFDRHSFDEDMLWHIIERTLNRSTTT